MPNPSKAVSAGVSGAVISVQLGHANGNVTTVGFPFDADHDDIAVLREADHGALNEHSQAMRTWLLSLPEEQQPYWTHLHQIDDLWPHHGDQPPVWVSAPGHPALEQAVAEHFTTRGHTCVVGNPNDASEE